MQRGVVFSDARCIWAMLSNNVNINHYLRRFMVMDLAHSCKDEVCYRKPPITERHQHHNSLRGSDHRFGFYHGGCSFTVM